MNRPMIKNNTAPILRALCLFLCVAVAAGLLSSCKFRKGDADVVTKDGSEQSTDGSQTVGNIKEPPVGVWETSLPFYKLGFTQISELRIDELASSIDKISDSVKAVLIFGENGEFMCLTERDKVLEACQKFGTGFLDILNGASVETMAKMKNMSVGDFENVLASYGKTKEDFAVEVTESLMRFIDGKTELFSGFESCGDDGMCVVFEGVFAVRGGRIYVGRSEDDVYNDGSMIADADGTKLYIAKDTDLHFFDDCEFTLSDDFRTEEETSE